MIGAYINGELIKAKFIRSLFFESEQGFFCNNKIDLTKSVR